MCGHFVVRCLQIVGYFCIPAFAKRLQGLLGLQHRGCLIDVAEISNHCATVGLGDILQSGLDQMHDAQLHASLGERRLNHLRESREPIDTGDEDVGHASILQIGQARQPERRPLRYVQPQKHGRQRHPREDSRRCGTAPMGPCFISTEDNGGKAPHQARPRCFNGAVLHQHGRPAAGRIREHRLVVASMGPCFISTEDCS